MASMKPRRRRIAPPVAIIAVLSLLLVGAPGASAKPGAMALFRGKAVFWNGIPDAPTCTNGSDPCWNYELVVREKAPTLRVGIDHVVVGDVFEVEVFSPSGALSSVFSAGSGLYSMEDLIPNPKRGTWRVRVTALGEIQDPRFRMRALLEQPARPPKRLMLPNLQVAPPYEFHFEFPVTDGGLRNVDNREIGLPAPAGPTSCHPEELLDQAVRCLRMAFGVGNVGLGPMELFYDDDSAAAAQTQALYQRMYYWDGSSKDRDTGGVAAYHPTHAHYHHDEAVSLQLFRVSDSKPRTLEPIGEELRKGFHHREEWLRAWDYFYPFWDWAPLSNGFGLGPGWGDYYEWDRPANYVDFGLEGDGEYVIQAMADPIQGVLESNERDNLGYTHFRVTGQSIEALESGRGKHPWDPCKIVLPIGNEPEPSAKQPRRPASCFADITRP